MKLETKRLILREWNKKDVNDSVQGLNNLEVSKWLALVPYPYTNKDAEKWINYCIKAARKGKKEILMILPLSLNLKKKLLEE